MNVHTVCSLGPIQQSPGNYTHHNAKLLRLHQLFIFTLQFRQRTQLFLLWQVLYQVLQMGEHTQNTQTHKELLLMQISFFFFSFSVHVRIKITLQTRMTGYNTQQQQKERVHESKATDCVAHQQTWLATWVFIRIRVYKHFTSVRPLMHFYRAMEEKVCACTVVNGYRLYAKLPSGSDTIKQGIFYSIHFSSLDLDLRRGLPTVWQEDEQIRSHNHCSQLAFLL